MNSTAQCPVKQAPRIRPPHPCDARETEATARFNHFLITLSRADLNHARSQLGALGELGFRVENLEPGYRLVGVTS